jgi:uncharacterized protein YfaS (alpha-2-macroglobulin family)
MNRRFTLLLVPALVIGIVWTLSRAASPPAEAPVAKGSAAVPAVPDFETPGGNDRYLTFLSTDKPIYRPGESVYMRGVPLHYLTRKPAVTNAMQQAMIEIKGPKGDTVASGLSLRQDSVFGFSWNIPDEEAGGKYTIKFSDPFTGQPPAECNFDIRAYRAPRLKTQIKFLRDGYGTGDEVVATLHAERAEGGLPAGAKITVSARVDGAEVYRRLTPIDDRGYCQARFKLPPTMSRGEGTLAWTIEDGAAVYSWPRKQNP